MSERFFSATPIDTQLVTLDGAEAHHLLHVMRAAIADVVTLFDGSGAEFTAVVESRARSAVTLRVMQRRKIDRELPISLAVGVALPKGDRQRWLVEKLTELGVTTLVPLETERGVAQPAAAARERLCRAVVEACKQCGRNRLMVISEPRPWREWLSSDLHSPAGPTALEARAAAGGRRLVAHPGGVLLPQRDVTRPLPTMLAIGPEGGFTGPEIAAATAAGWQIVDLGPRILRVETAAIALASGMALVAPQSGGS